MAARRKNSPRVAAELERLERDRLGELLATRRFCYVIPADAFVEGRGFRVSIAIEREPGHFPTGDDRAMAGDLSNGARMPWFWGMTFADAELTCADMNARMGIDAKTAAMIVATTLNGTRRKA